MSGPIGGGKIHGYCGLCIAQCGTVATVEDGRFTRLDPDPSHPTGQAICAKGRAAPELVYHNDRLTQPLRRSPLIPGSRDAIECRAISRNSRSHCLLDGDRAMRGYFTSASVLWPGPLLGLRLALYTGHARLSGHSP
jgi:hypothetical protein